MVRIRRKGKLSPKQQAVSQQVVAKLAGTNQPPTRIRRYLPKNAGQCWNPNDPETVEGRLARYNPEDWYAPAKDDKGHSSERMLLTFHPAVMEELNAHVNSGRFPLGKSVAQAVRVAVHEFLQILRRLEPVPNSHMGIIETLTYLNQHAVVTMGYEEQFTTACQRIHKLMTQGAMNEARKMAHDTLVLAKKIEASELRDKYVAQVTGQFKGLLKSAKNKVKTNVQRNKVVRRKRAQMAAQAEV